MSYPKGVVYVTLWYFSILSGYAGLFAPLLPVLFISNRLYRNLVDYIFTFWQMYPAALMKFLFNTKITVIGDPVDQDEMSLLIMNHRTRTDWNFFWPAIYHASSGNARWHRPTKFVLKDQIRKIPGIGWVMELTSFFFLKRQWSSDQKHLKSTLDYFCNLKYKFSLLLFPEGTDFCPDTKSRSDRFASDNNLPKYEYVLHPRTTGFVYLASRLIQCNVLEAIYDVTVVYCDTVPQRETFLFKGVFPKEVIFIFQKYPKDDLPLDEEGLKNFLMDRWLAKENLLAHFANNHMLPGSGNSQKGIYRNSTELYVALLFWTLFPCAVLYLLTISQLFRRYLLFHTVFLLCVSHLGGGFQNFEISLYNLKRRLHLAG